MNYDNSNGSGFGQQGNPPSGEMPPSEGMPSGGFSPAPMPEEPDIKISNTGQKVAAIVVAALLLVAGIAVLVMMNNKKKEIEKYEEVRAAFQKAHTAGYLSFWKQVQVDVKEMKSNADFEAKMRTVTADPVRYARHIKESGLSVLDTALPLYKGIVAPADLTEKIDNVAKAVTDMRTAWNDFASEFAKFDDFFRANEKLEPASSHWLGFQQQPNNEKFLIGAVRYFKILQCIFKDQKIDELDYENMESEVTATCAKAAAKPGWFRHTAFECFQNLLKPAGAPDEAFAAAVKVADKAFDTTSKFGIDTCIKKSREYFEAEEFQKLAVPWMEYIKAQNELLSAVDEKIKALR
jgi:hypothetical protein